MKSSQGHLGSKEQTQASSPSLSLRHASLASSIPQLPFWNECKAALTWVEGLDGRVPSWGPFPPPEAPWGWWLGGVGAGPEGGISDGESRVRPAVGGRHWKLLLAGPGGAGRAREQCDLDRVTCDN